MPLTLFGGISRDYVLRRSAPRFPHRSGGFRSSIIALTLPAISRLRPRTGDLRARNWRYLIRKDQPQMINPERKAENTIVRPTGFTSSLSSMDVPRPDIAAKKRKKRIMIVAGDRCLV